MASYGRSGDGNTRFVGQEFLQTTSDAVPLSVNLDADATEPSGDTLIEAGNILTKYTSGGNQGEYTTYVDGGSDGAGDESNAVVLAEDVDLSNESGTVLVTAYTQCTVKEDEIIVDSNFDESAQQNITFWSE
jgi:hypothetical protein